MLTAGAVLGSEKRCAAHIPGTNSAHCTRPTATMGAPSGYDLDPFFSSIQPGSAPSQTPTPVTP